MSEYTQVDLQIGTEAQFETKKATLSEGTIVGLTDPIHENELDSALQTKLNNKVDKITGKGLSTNDFTNDEKTKLAGIEAEAQVNVIETITAGENVTVSKDGKNVTISATGGGATYEVVEITNSQTTLTDEQYNTLIASPFNKIKYNNIIYDLYQNTESDLFYVSLYWNITYRIIIKKATKNITSDNKSLLTAISSHVINNLDYNKSNTAYALSAYQGKVLNDRLKALEDASGSGGGGGVTSVTTSGTGNAVTSASISGNELTLTKGSTFLTAHQSLASCAKLSANNVFTGNNTFKNPVTIKGTSSSHALKIEFDQGSTTYQQGLIQYQPSKTGNTYNLNMPTKTGTLALTSDIPTIEANPTASGTTALTKLKVGTTVYTLPEDKPTIVLQTSTSNRVTGHYGRIYYIFSVDSGIINDVSSGKYNVIIYDQTSGGGYYYCPLQGDTMTFLGEEVPNNTTVPSSIVGWSFKAKESATTLSFWRDSFSLSGGGGTAGVSSLGGQTGAITLGDGLSMNSNQLVPKIKNIYTDASGYLCIETNE